MSTRRKDRHQRGLRGPLALPNPYGARARPPRPANRAAFFDDSVHAAVDRIAATCPDALLGVTFGIEDVPQLPPSWAGDRVPLAAAVAADAEQLAQVVIYRRPLEHRAASRRGLQILVYRTIVEQLSALTGRPVSDFDDEGAAPDDD
ncbi:metallopeptidase family protein [Microlunatus phosphovorus]|nr:metallopeptidase family protein [Microlunatus phosphovorus]